MSVVEDTHLVVEGLVVAYDGRVALSGLDLAVPPASTLAVIGPNGSGKSTLLRAIAGLVQPRSGTVDLGDATVALVLQTTDVERGVPITVRDTVAMARYATTGLLRRFGRRDHDAVRSAMERLGVADLADRQLHDLSGGQRQRVLVAQGLAQDADILLLDEPVTGLDVTARDAVLDVIAQERAGGRTVVTTTHSLEDARRCDRVLLLNRGPVALGPPEEVLSEENLGEAFDARMLRVGGDFATDDPHHVH